MKRRKYMKEENKHNYKYGKPYYLKNKKKKNKNAFRNFSFKKSFRKLRAKTRLSFDLRVKKVKAQINKIEKPKISFEEIFFNFKSKLNNAKSALKAKKNNKYFTGGVALLLVFLVVFATYSHLSNAHLVIYADDKPIGYVTDEEQLNAMMSVLHDYGPSASQDLYNDKMALLSSKDELPKVEDPEKVMGTEQPASFIVEQAAQTRYTIMTEITTEKIYKQPEDLEELNIEKFKNSIYIETSAAVIVINDEEVAALKDCETAQNLVDLIIESHLTERGGAEIIDYTVKEDIQILAKDVSPERILEYDMVLNLLSTGYTERQVHVVQRGDSLWSIGDRNGMSVSELKECNPNIESNLLRPGQKIAVEPLVPYVHVETKEKVSATEYIPYSTNYVNDSSLYTWQTKTIKAGVRGQEKVVFEVVRLNGAEQSRKKLSTELVKEPVTRVVAKGTKKPKATGTGAFIWPVNGRGSITSPFGWTGRRYHRGIDIAAPTGTNIFAADDGIITTSSYHRSYGYYIIIDHGNGYSTLYAHNSRLLKSAGTKVSKGDVICRSGNTGNSTGPHLHFEVRYNGSHKNPMNYFK